MLQGLSDCLEARSLQSHESVAALTPLKPVRGRSAITEALHKAECTACLETRLTPVGGVTAPQLCHSPMLWDHRCLSPELVPHRTQRLVQGQTQSWERCSPAEPCSPPSSQPAMEVLWAWTLPNNSHQQAECQLGENTHLQGKQVRASPL